MTRTTIRLILFVLAASLMLGGIVSCFGGDQEEEEVPTADIQATIDAAVKAATPTETPTPEPTDTPVPTEAPTPDIAATVAAAIAAAQPPTVAPVQTAPTPVPEPTATPVPTSTPVPTHTPTPSAEQSSGPPCIVAGTVRFGNSLAPAGIPVFAQSQSADVVVETVTDANGRYVLAISNFDMRFDLFVGSTDTEQDTPITSRGCREIRDLSVG